MQFCFVARNLVSKMGIRSTEAHIYIYIYLSIYTYMLAPPLRSTFWCSSKDLHNQLTAYINLLIMQWVWSCKSCKPFKETASQQTIDHSSKHPLFLSEEVQFFFSKLFNFWEIMQYFFQNTRFLHNMQCVINIEYCCKNVQWLVIMTAFLEKKDCG